tara:strand:- start:44500 stop:45798 length:1299 start_codon:yes stop_codon:yes gene_type:complete
LFIKKIFNSQLIQVSAIGSLGVKFLSILFAFLNGVILARLMNLENYGIYIVAFSTLTIVSTVVSFGLPSLITRLIPQYQIKNEMALIKGLIIRSNRIVLFFCLVVFIVAILIYFSFGRNYSSLWAETFFYALIGLPFIVLASLRAATLRGLRYVLLGQLPDTFLRNFLFFMGILFFLVSKYRLTPPIAMMIFTISTIISFAVGYYFLKHKLLISLRKTEPIYLKKEWMKETIPYSVMGGIDILKSNILTYVLAIFGSLEAVPIFEIAVRGSALMSFTLEGLNSATAPYISSRFAQNDIKGLQRLVTKTARLVFGIALIVALIFIFEGKSLLEIFYGDKYSIAYIPLLILCCGHLVNAFTGSSGIVLNMTGHQSYMSKTLIMMTIIVLTVSIPMVSNYDVIGASLVLSSIFIIQNLLWVIYIKRKLNINTTIL